MITHFLLVLSGPLAFGVSTAVQEVDTVLVMPARDGFDIVMATAAGLVGLAFLGLFITIVVALVEAKKVSRALDAARRRISADRGVEHLRNTARHLEEISSTFRDEATRMAGSVEALSDRLTQASDRMEERIEEFNALMEVIQAEAEEVFVDTASTARGVRRGMGRLTDPPRKRRETTKSPGSESAPSPDAPSSGREGESE